MPRPKTLHPLVLDLPTPLLPASLPLELATNHLLEGLLLTGSAESLLLPHRQIRESHLDRASLSLSIFEHFDAAELLLTGVNLCATKTPLSSYYRVIARRCRMTGFTAPDASFTDILIEDSKLDFANFRYSRFKRVVFRRCNLTEVDFTELIAAALILDHCDLTNAHLYHAKLAGTDLRTCTLTGLQGLEALRGTIISEAQLIELGPSLAAELGIQISPHPAP